MNAQSLAKSVFRTRQETFFGILVLLACIAAMVNVIPDLAPREVLHFFRGGTAFEKFSLAMFLIFLVPAVSERFGIPGAVGIVAAGIIVGPDVLKIISRDSHGARFFGDIGKIYLMFLAGLEINLDHFKKNYLQSVRFGFFTFAFPMVLGIGLGRLLGYSLNASFLIGSLLASHTLLGFPIVQRLGLANSRSVAVVVGATIFTDVVSLFVLAICIGIHMTGFSVYALVTQMTQLVVYVLVVCFGLSWLTKRYLEFRKGDESKQYFMVFSLLLIAAIGAEKIHMENIVGAFLAGIAVNRAIGHSKIIEKVDFLGKIFFIPLFFLSIGIALDLKVFLATVDKQTLLVFSVVTVLVLAKLLAALAARAADKFSKNETLLLWSLSLPQVAATLAAAIAAYQALDAHGNPLIDSNMINAVVVLMVVTSTLGPMLTEYFGKRVAAAKGK